MKQPWQGENNEKLRRLLMDYYAVTGQRLSLIHIYMCIRDRPSPRRGRTSPPLHGPRGWTPTPTPSTCALNKGETTMAYTLAPKTEALTPYDPVEGEYRVRLDANESFLLPTDTDREKMARAAAEAALNRYPDPLATRLCEAFAARYQVKPALVTAGHGSDALISIILSTFLQKGEKVLTLSPDFSMYAFYTSITETPCITLPKKPDMTVDVTAVIDTIRREGVRLLIFSNPCNPTSVGLPRDGVRRLLRETDALVVLDEAYMDFWDQSMLGEVEAYDNLILLRTCSKMCIRDSPRLRRLLLRRAYGGNFGGQPSGPPLRVQEMQVFRVFHRRLGRLRLRFAGQALPELRRTAGTGRP